MSAFETGQMSIVETSQMYSIKTGQGPVAMVCICLASAAGVDVCPISAADILPVSTADTCAVPTEDNSTISTPDFGWLRGDFMPTWGRLRADLGPD